MKRMKKHKPKPVMPETSNFRLKDNEEHDLAYYINDRVELMHQAFSVIKTKELKAMIPKCVNNLSLDDLQELCTEELLGISSKRLCAILDGAEPPSDTESSSSSPEQMETISLDSISSDDEVLSQSSSKTKKRKHKKRKAKNKHKRQESDNNDDSSDGEEKNRASRAGLTVLELLELQARARAIRAQLQKDQINNKAQEGTENMEMEQSDDEVEIKEEPTEVVEISSEDEKPNVEQLNAQVAQKSRDQDLVKDLECSTTVTKRVNDLIINVPQTKQTRKIKLNRNKVVMCETAKPTTPTNNGENGKEEKKVSTNDTNKTRDPKKSKTKKRDKNRQKVSKKDGSDHDEITLQLSDTEKMDLLEDLDRKNYDCVSSSSKDSDSSSESSDDTSNKHSDREERTYQKIEKSDQKMCNTMNTDEIMMVCDNSLPVHTESINKTKENFNAEDAVAVAIKSTSVEDNENLETECNNTLTPNLNDEYTVMNVDNVSTDLKDINSVGKENNVEASNANNDQISDGEKFVEHVPVSTNETKSKENEPAKEHADQSKTQSKEDKLSDGEISEESDAAKSAAVNEIVCLSDDEKTKKKKDKKGKKKCKKSHAKEKEPKSKDDDNLEILTLDDEDEDEIFELSDDSSCYEVEGVSVLSKEPTTFEIEALSAKVDDTIRGEIGIEVEDNESLQSEKEDAENISWKDRYLDSKKVKHVLKTSKILNALRKKNKELKKKLEESKKTPLVLPIEEESEKVEGTIDEYNNLQGSTKYVNPVPEKSEEAEGEVKEVTKEMEKDAKQLLKMYKKLLKYNDMNRQKSKDPNRKKSKKYKKKKEKHKDKGAIGGSSTTAP